MAKLTLAMTLTDPNDYKKVLGYSVSLSWIDENNDRSSKQKLDCFCVREEAWQNACLQNKFVG